MQVFIKKTFQAEKKIPGCQVKCIMKSTFSRRSVWPARKCNYFNFFYFLQLILATTLTKRCKTATFFVVLKTTFMKCYSFPSPQCGLLPNQNPRSLWGSCSACFSQPAGADSEPPKASGMCFLQLHGTGTGLWTTSLLFYNLVISLCIFLLLTPPFWKHLMRQMKGRVNGKIISCIFTDLLSQ